MAWSNQRQRHGTSGWAWQRTVRSVIERDGGVCRFDIPGCTRMAATAGHVIAKAAGGSDHPSNLRASCAACNEAKRRQEARDGRPQRRRDPESHPGEVG